MRRRIMFCRRRLTKVAVTGCAIQSWQGAKVSMICFRTGKPLAAG